MQNDETAALATTQPVADAEVERVCVALLAGIKDYTYDGLVGTSAGLIREAAALIRRLLAERDEARQIVRDTLWMAGRYADGRRTYAVSMYNDARRIAEAGGFASKEDPTRTEPAIDGDAPEWPTLAERLRQAEADRDEARRLLAEARDALKPFARFLGDKLCAPEPHNDDADIWFGTKKYGVRVGDFRRARATLARLDAALTGDAR